MCTGATVTACQSKHVKKTRNFRTNSMIMFTRENLTVKLYFWSIVIEQKTS